jgi:hypothetical protein
VTALAIHGAGGGERYTKPREINQVRAALGGTIDLDPCSCELANRTVRAERFLSRTDDGLRAEWGGRVWVNPPSSRAGFVDAAGDRHHEPCVWWVKLHAELWAGRVSGAVFLIFSAETLRHMTRYKVPHPADGRMIWLYERPSFLGPDGDEIRDKTTGKVQSPAHLGAMAIIGDVDTKPLEKIGRLTGAP